MTKTLSLRGARKLAKEYHGNQKDKLGLPYMEHLEAVRAGVVVLGGGVEEQIAALLHDIIEDTSVTAARLIEEGISDSALKIVVAVTKGNNEAQTKYLARVIAAGDGAMRVKVADLLHNIRHDRMQALIDDNKGYVVKRLLRKYRPSLARLQMELGLIGKNTDVDTIPEGTGGGTYTYTSTTSGLDKGTISAKADTLLPNEWPKNWKSPVGQGDVTESEDKKFILVPLLDGTVKEVSATTLLTIWPSAEWLSKYCSGISDVDRRAAIAKLAEEGPDGKSREKALLALQEMTLPYGVDKGKFVTRSGKPEKGLCTSHVIASTTNDGPRITVLYEDGIEKVELVALLTSTYPPQGVKDKLLGLAGAMPVPEASGTLPDLPSRYIKNHNDDTRVYCTDCKYSIIRTAVPSHEDFSHKQGTKLSAVLTKDDRYVDDKTGSKDFKWCRSCRVLVPTVSVNHHEKLSHTRKAVTQTAELP